MKKYVILFIACLLLFSCAPKKPAKVGNPVDLYIEGVNLMKNKKYDQAIKKFSEIRENYPFDPIAFVATVKLADTHFEKKDYVLASSIYEDFFNAHPEDENIPYVVYRLAECYEKLSLSLDRDQAYTLKGIERLTYLKNRFPTSTYAKDGETRLKKLMQKISDRELYVGEFYFRTDEYNAAIHRLEYFLKKYPGAPGTDRAFFYLSMSYMNLGNLEKGQYYLDILKKEYPKSLYARTTIRQRKSLQLAKVQPQAPPAGEGVVTRKREIPLEPQAEKTVKLEKEEKGNDLEFFDEKKPIDIISDTMEGYEQGKQVIFRGNVIAKQEDLFIYSDILEAYIDGQTNEIEKAYAKGNVRIVKQQRTATSKEAMFDNDKREITLIGNVVVVSGQDKITGDTVTYYVNEDRVVVKGQKDKKAHIIVTPKQ